MDTWTLLTIVIPSYKLGCHFPHWMHLKNLWHTTAWIELPHELFIVTVIVKLYMICAWVNNPWCVHAFLWGGTQHLVISEYHSNHHCFGVVPVNQSVGFSKWVLSIYEAWLWFLPYVNVLLLYFCFVFLNVFYRRKLQK